MRLADFILDQMEAILQEWENFARTMEPAAASMTSMALRNHASIMLKAVADDLCVPQSPQQQAAKARGRAPRTVENGTGESHGIARLESHFTLEQLVAEYRALRASVLRMWGESDRTPCETDMDDITRFNESIDQLLAASVASFAQATRRAQEAEKQRRDQFLAMLAHELRNPLSPISAAASLLKIAKENQEIVHNASNIISRQVTHMATLVDDLLDVSRVTRGLIKLRMVPLDMRVVIDDAVEQVTPQLQARHHQLSIGDPPAEAIVRADEKRLVQVITNLLTNAAKYTPEHGQIRLNVAVDEDQVLIEVEDNGIGMAPEFVPHVFDLFAQAERTPDRSSGGLGLGLALVKSLMELHGGSAACSSPGLGKGSRFTLSLPRVRDAGAHVERRRAPRVELAAGRPLTIMVVDDNVDAAQTLGLLLKTAGHEVIVEHEAQRALELARTRAPDLCLLDIGLPGMDGNEMARRLRGDPATSAIALMALTGYCQVHDRDEALMAGFDHYMTKPVDIVKLQAVLAACPRTS